MKTLIFLMAGLFPAMAGAPGSAAPQLTGAWEYVNQGQTTSSIFSDRYFSTAVYDRGNKKFLYTYGGAWRMDGEELVQQLEFHSGEPAMVGKEIRSLVQEKNKQLIVSKDGKKQPWKRVDDGSPGKLAGAWLITGRVEGGEMRYRKPGVRKTMKILSGTRFQWIAYNVETKEFFGTGGGTYLTEAGKYTENIDFFSRDNSRVGASLQFDFSLEAENWRHKGLSSKGDPIDEVWTQREKLEEE